MAEAERRSFVRVDSAKVNLAPATSAKWFRLAGARMASTDGYWMQVSHALNSMEFFRVTSAHASTSPPLNNWSLASKKRS
jgi:hypothetical protein